MKVYTTLEGIQLNEKTVTALGNFDGVHLGHREILATAVREAKKRGCLSACYTFSNHPRRLFKDLGVIDKTLGYICTDDEKLELLEAAGIDVVFDVPFDEAVMKMPAESFIADILCDTMNVAGVSCGFNYRYGAKAGGDTAMLLWEGEQRGFATFVHDAVEVDGIVVSSTVIREGIEAGDMERVAKCLGRAYSAQGIVIKGNQIGSRIGFPTANIAFDASRVAPPNGVYFTEAVLEGKRMPAVTNVGVKPTIGDYEKSIETHIFGMDEPLYGKNVRIEFLHWQRPEQKFESVKKLAEQIALDRDAAVKFHEARASR